MKEFIKDGKKICIELTPITESDGKLGSKVYLKAIEKNVIIKEVVKLNPESIEFSNYKELQDFLKKLKKVDEESTKQYLFRK